MLVIWAVKLEKGFIIIVSTQFVLSSLHVKSLNTKYITRSAFERGTQGSRTF